MEKPNYYAIIPANVRYCNDLKCNEKFMYGEITALSQADGKCWATNGYFANLYDVSVETVSRWISNLERQGFVKRDVIYKEGSKEIDKRFLRISLDPIDEKINTPRRKDQGGIDEKINTPIDEKIKDNNTSINTTRDNTFRKPTQKEVEDYIIEKNYNVDAEEFINHYEANGWKQGKTPLKSWKHALANWHRRSIKRKLEDVDLEELAMEYLKLVESGTHKTFALNKCLNKIRSYKAKDDFRKIVYELDNQIAVARYERDKAFEESMASEEEELF